MNNSESDQFLTLDDHIFLDEEAVRETLDETGHHFLDNLVELGGQEFRTLASRMLAAAGYEGVDTRLPEVGRRAFMFGKLIGFMLVEQSSKSRSYIQNEVPDEKENDVDHNLETLVMASLCEYRDAPLYRSLIEEHMETIDPTGKANEVVRLFAGYSLFLIQNSLYFQSSYEKMESEQNLMSNASDEQWQKSLDNLLGEDE